MRASEKERLSNVLCPTQVILIQRTLDGGVFYKYFGHDQDIEQKTWSSFETFGMANAAG